METTQQVTFAASWKSRILYFWSTFQMMIVNFQSSFSKNTEEGVSQVSSGLLCPSATTNIGPYGAFLIPLGFQGVHFLKHLKLKLLFGTMIQHSLGKEPKRNSQMKSVCIIILPTNHLASTKRLSSPS